MLLNCILYLRNIRTNLCAISLDLWMDGLCDNGEDEFTPEQMDADFDDSESENYLKQFCRHSAVLAS